MIMMVKDKPKSVILWGFNDLAKQYIDILMEIGISTKYIIDPDDHGNVYKDIKIVSPEAYKKEINASKDIPMIITGGKLPNGESADFVRSLTESLNYLWDEDTKILHPCFIAQYLGLNLRGKAMVIGCNRSGSTVLFNIIKNILETDTISRQGCRERLVEQLTEEHFNSITQYLNGIFYNKNRCFSTIGSTTFKSINYFDARPNEFFYMSPIASDRYLFDRVHRTYSVINREIIDYAQKNKYQLFFPLRNPLDVIISNAFQFENIFFNMYPSEFVDKAESQFREQYGLSNLHNLEWFESMAGVVKKYMEAFLELKQDIFSVKYEDLISDPITTIQQIADKLSVNIEESFAAALWERIGFKPLTLYKAHMFRPGKNKWMKYMTKSHMEILEKLHYPELTKLLGYDIDYHHHSKSDIYDKLTANQTLRKALAIRDNILNIEFKKPVNFVDEEIICKEYAALGREFKFVSNSSVFLDAFKNATADKTFEKILSSSYL